MTVIDLTAARDKRDGPDCEHVTTDAVGASWFAFSAVYRDDESGKTYGLTFWALDMNDAQRRIGCIRDSITLTGQIYATVPE